jgi:hypothetical protein
LLIDLALQAYSKVVNWDIFPRPDEQRVVIDALLALEQVRHPLVRTFALALMNDPALRRWSTGLLVANVEEEDYQRVGAYLDPLSDEELIHASARDVADMAARLPSVAAVPVLWTLYERNPCSACREEIITALVELAALPDWVAHECLHDANLTIRSRVRRYLNP